MLIAVFVPLAFISGLTGQFYRQFALTIAISTVISAFNSLTLSPALAALLLKAHDAPKDALTRGMDRVFGWFFRALQPRLPAAAPKPTAAASSGVISRKAIDAGRLSRADRRRPSGCSRRCPAASCPAQDKQYLIGFAQLPDGATLDRTEDVIRRMGDIALKQPGVESAVAFPGPVDQRLHQQLELRHRVRRR